MSSNIETDAVLSISPEEVNEQIETFVDEDYTVIIGTSQDYVEAFRRSSDQHPHVRFLVVSGFDHGPNIGSYSGRLYQVMYIFGTVAGSVTETGTVGVIGAVAVPEMVLHVNAFTRGVRSVDPDAVVVVEWLGDWYSTEELPEEHDIVDDLVTRSGADVVLYTTDTLSPMAHICEMQDGDSSNGEFPDGTPRVYAFGGWWGVCTHCPDYCLMTAQWNWGTLLTEVIEDMRRGEWLPSGEPWSQISARRDESVVHFSSQ